MSDIKKIVGWINSKNKHLELKSKTAADVFDLTETYSKEIKKLDTLIRRVLDKVPGSRANFVLTERMDSSKTSVTAQVSIHPRMKNLQLLEYSYSLFKFGAEDFAQAEQHLVTRGAEVVKLANRWYDEDRG